MKVKIEFIYNFKQEMPTKKATAYRKEQIMLEKTFLDFFCLLS